jgi:uncharacterized protein YcfJ
MRKYISSFLMMAMMAVMIPVLVTDTNAQTRRNRQQVYRNYERNDRSVYDKHRNLINIGIGTAAGAIIGGLIGGKKGALIGTAVGAGGSALYTYKLNPKTKKYERVYNRNARNYRRY